MRQLNLIQYQDMLIDVINELSFEIVNNSVNLRFRDSLMLYFDALRILHELDDVQKQIISCQNSKS